LYLCKKKQKGQKEKRTLNEFNAMKSMYTLGFGIILPVFSASPAAQELSFHGAPAHRAKSQHAGPRAGFAGIFFQEQALE